jgi:hypothetical protein
LKRKITLVKEKGKGKKNEDQIKKNLWLKDKIENKTLTKGSRKKIRTELKK